MNIFQMKIATKMKHISVSFLINTRMLLTKRIMALNRWNLLISKMPPLYFRFYSMSLLLLIFQQMPPVALHSWDRKNFASRVAPCNAVFVVAVEPTHRRNIRSLMPSTATHLIGGRALLSSKGLNTNMWQLH